MRIEIETLCLRRAIALGDVRWESELVAAYHALSRTPLAYTPEAAVGGQAGAARMTESWSHLHGRFHEALIATCDSPLGCCGCARNCSRRLNATGAFRCRCSARRGTPTPSIAPSCKPPSSALSAGGDSEVYAVANGHYNLGGEIGQLSADFKRKFNEDLYTWSIHNGLTMLSAAIAKARSAEPLKVARALEGLQFKSFAGEVTMRAADHQLQQTMFIAKWQKADSKYAYSVENTGYTFAPIRQMDPYVSSTSTSCQMKRPPAS